MTLKTATSSDLLKAFNGAYGGKARLQVVHMMNLFIAWAKENDTLHEENYDLARIRDMYLQGIFDDVDAGDDELINQLLELM